MAHLPNAIGLILCRDYIIQEKTRNVSLVHCFSALPAKTLPVDVGPFFAVAKLADGEGEIILHLIVSHLSSLKEVYSRRFSITLGNRLEEIWCFLRIKRVRFSLPGRYHVALNAENQFLAQCTLDINP